MTLQDKVVEFHATAVAKAVAGGEVPVNGAHRLVLAAGRKRDGSIFREKLWRDLCPGEHYPYWPAN